MNSPCRTDYADALPPHAGLYRVTFMNESGTRLTRSFDSQYQASQFARKIKYSRKCRLVSTPLFR